MSRRINYRIDTKKYRVREYKDGKEKTIGHFNTLREAKIAQAGHHWTAGVTPDPENNFGFIYEVVDKLTGMHYIGKKQYWFYDSSSGLKSSNNVEEGWVQDAWTFSDWRDYRTSSEVLKPIIEERPQDFIFSILAQCKSKLDLHLAEVDYQMKYDVLNAVLPNGERKYWNQNIASCEFNVHDSGEGARAIRYNPLYRAWKKMMADGPVWSDWEDFKVFKKEMGKAAKGMSSPVIIKTSGGDEQGYSIFNTKIINKGDSYISPIYKGVAWVDGSWKGRINDGGRVFEVTANTDREAAAKLDAIIEQENLALEKQLKWV